MYLSHSLTSSSNERREREVRGDISAGLSGVAQALPHKGSRTHSLVRSGKTGKLSEREMRNWLFVLRCRQRAVIPLALAVAEAADAFAVLFARVSLPVGTSTVEGHHAGLWRLLAPPQNVSTGMVFIFLFLARYWQERAIL